MIAPQEVHQGQRRTLELLKLRYYWPNIKEDVNNYVDTCKSCNERNPHPKDKLKVPMVITNTLQAAFDTVHIDVVGPLHVIDDNYRYLLTFQDAFTKYPEAIPIPDQTAETIAKHFAREIICKHGMPKSLISDQGANFMSELFTEVCKPLKIQKLRTTAFHPRTNGQVERFHRNFIEYLSHFVNKDQRDWSDWVPYALLEYRAAPQTTTGFSPFCMVHGREPNLPSEIVFDDSPHQQELSEEDYVQEITTRLKEAFQTARERIIKSKEKSKVYYDKNTKKYFNQENLFCYLMKPLKEVVPES